jgi:transcriptional regulator with XRE-family HTH domain
MTILTKRTYSAYSRDAMHLFGSLIQSARKRQKMSEQMLAVRTGVSRGLIRRIEAGDMRCDIGAVFETAHILRIPLFDSGPSRFASQIRQVQDNLSLLPKAIHKKTKVINDDF